MSKNKLQKFSEMKSFSRVFQPEFEDVFKKDYYLKGQWAEKVFENAKPLTLELGCGKGEYSVGLAMRYENRNFIGVDIKGARIWRGAKTAEEQGLKNVAFLRTRIEFIESFFGSSEVSEIWITFPDPQLKKRRNKKRLTGARFLNHYRSFLLDMGLVHLKTDNDVMHQYTKDLVEYNGLEIVNCTSDLYNSDVEDDILEIKTHYEKLFLAEGSNINYISFRLPVKPEIRELPDDE